MNINKTALGLGFALATVAASSSAYAQDTTVGSEPPMSTTVTSTAASSPTPYGSDVPISEKTIPNRPLLLGSGTLLLASYVPTAIVGAVSDRDEDRYLFIPVVGPWVDLGQRDCDGNACGNNEDLNKGLLIGTGIVQGLGAIGVISSFFVPERRTRLSIASVPEKKFTVTPSKLGRAGYGFAAIGTF